MIEELVFEAMERHLHVRWSYEGSEPSPAAAGSLDPARLAWVGAPWLSAMAQARGAGDVDAAAAHARDLAASDADLSARLLALLERFDLEAVAAAGEQARGAAETSDL